MAGIVNIAGAAANASRSVQRDVQRKSTYGGAVQLVITRTFKPMGRSDRDWETFDQEVKTFSNMHEAKEWISKQYGKAKRSPMYVDDAKGRPKKVGYIFSSKNYDFDHDTGKRVHFFQQDWVSFRAISDLEL
jgi:hypothetical protein